MALQNVQSFFLYEAPYFTSYRHVYHTIHYVISDKTIRSGENGEKDDNSGYLNIDSETMELLENIQQAMGQEKHTTHVITGLLTMLVIILTTFVLYLCFSRGISSMSKYVMWYIWLSFLYLLALNLKRTLLVNKEQH